MKLPPLGLNGSLRWQLQLWHGLLLFLVLLGFGWMSWQFQRASLMVRVDKDLAHRAQQVIGALHLHVPSHPPAHAPPPPPGSPGGVFRNDHDRPPPPPRPEEDERSRYEEPMHAMERLEMEIGKKPYFEAVWGPQGLGLWRSPSTPASITRPPAGSEHSGFRNHDNIREYFEFMGGGECILVAKDLSEDMAFLQRSAWMLFAAASGVLILGLFIGWMITTAAIRPLVAINKTAADIAEGDLSQRIPVPPGRNEIADLVKVLNQTFSRLQASFERQSQFTADASHELRTPLSVILAQTQNALARERTGDEYRAGLEACQRAAKRMQQLTESLLALVRIDQGGDAGERSPCRLDHLAMDAAELLTPLAAEQQISVECDLEPLSTLGNPGQLAQVITNLLENAIRYNAPGGRVLLRTYREHGFNVLRVEDTGRGIAPENIPHLFERFFRADKSRAGVASGEGLGLAISQAIVKSHGGAIGVVSSLGEGSVFTVKLPD